MKLYLQLLELLLLLIVVSECRSVQHNREKESRLSMVHLLRSKRFDFTMFGCSDCRPVMECHTDSYCKYKKGTKYTCQFRCCSFRCVITSSGSDRVSSFFNNDEAHDDTGSGSDGNQHYQDFTADALETERTSNSTETTTIASVDLDISIEHSTTPEQNDIKEDKNNEDG